VEKALPVEDESFRQKINHPGELFAEQIYRSGEQIYLFAVPI
jgi:hypothetical protein